MWESKFFDKFGKERIAYIFILIYKIQNYIKLAL
nr:hypothetical protein [Mucilaginibacter sp. SP1R1]